MRKIQSKLLCSVILAAILPGTANAEWIKYDRLYRYYVDYHLNMNYWSRAIKGNFYYRFAPVEITVNGRKYTPWVQVDETGVVDSADMNVKALLRESNGRVYMLTGEYIRPDVWTGTYGFHDKELMVYDGNLKVGDTYQIGTDEIYPAQGDDASWMSSLSYYSNGRMKVIQSDTDPATGLRHWVLQQTMTEGLHPSAYFDAKEVRTFDVYDGIGSPESLFPWPGAFGPLPVEAIPGNNPCFYSAKLSKVWKLDYADFPVEVIFEDKSVPGGDADVEEIPAADNEKDTTPKYYTPDGLRVYKPMRGGVYIVRRGPEVSKEVY